ncbi:alpha/beta hydrolase [Sphingomonas sp. SUN039]|uniref:alpha/beta hydrolase n=1 Tax=Sphingomonas sp. SUN039 TaxID=2937787 RepID=UPI0021643A8D|nr:alpha/beta hydrolase [Sphingomonas sp. SUN039]UVO53119.1 alpha/beta hydrolase [Sphingomonas sp. SUN039]
MRGAISSMVAALVLIGSSAVAAPPRDFPVGAKPVPGDVYPDRVTRFPGGVTGLADVEYASIPGYRPEIVDLYLPPKGKVATPRPLVIYIHGGGWVGGHTRQAAAFSNFPGVLAKLASEGFVVASLEYRLAGEARFPAQLQDVRAAIRFLKGNAAKYGIDASRVALWGGSAGGHLAALGALSCGASGIDAKPQPAGSECVQGAVIWYGVFDFAPLVARAEGAPVGLLGCATGASCPADKIAAVSPLTYLDAKDPPFLLIHGDADKVVSVDQSLTAFDRMKAVGVPVDKIVFTGIDHSFIGTTPKATRDASLTAINASFDFFHRLFDKK